MGVVFRAHDPELGRVVALKCLRPRYVADNGAGRLLREARGLAQLSHPNVVAIFGVEHEHGGLALAMEHVEGETLDEWLRREPSWPEALELMLAAGRGLQAAHAAGLVHRDFKPSNVLVGRDGRVRVMDFGLVRATRGDSTSLQSLEPSRSSGDDFPVGSVDDDRTQAGMVMGTIAYMSPEQANGREADPRSDQYAFCVSLWEALTGTRPFGGRDMSEVQLAKLDGPPPWPSGVVVPPALIELVRLGLSPRPQDRWTSMTALLDELARIGEPPRRRFRAPLVAGLLVLSVGGLGLHLFDPAPAPKCTGAKARLAEVWSPSRADAIRSALAGVSDAHLEETWPRVEPRLEAYGQRWSASHTEACEATHVRFESAPESMDLRMACLDRAHAELRHVVELLADPKGVVANRAVALIEALPRPEHCMDPTTAPDADMPVPDDPTLAAEVQSIRVALTEVKARQRAKAYDEAMSMLGPLLERARRSNFDPIVGAAIFRRGILHDALGEHEAARDDFSTAYSLATEHDYPLLAQQSASRLGYIVGHRLASPEEGLRWAQTAVAEAQRMGSGSIEADARETMAIVLTMHGRYDDAAKEQRRAIELLEQAHAADPEEVTELELADSYDALGNMVEEQGLVEESVALHRRALEIQERDLGPRHLDVATTLNNLSSALTDLDQDAEAIALLERALEIRERVLGPDHRALVSVVNNLGVALQDTDDPRRAEPYLERALALSTKAYGEDHPYVGSALVNLGNLYEILGDPRAAHDHFRRSLDTWERALGPDHPKVALALANLGDLALDQGRIDEAIERHERALAIRREAMGERHPLAMLSELRLARARLARGQAGAASDTARSVLTRLETLGEIPRELEDEARSLVADTQRALASEHEGAAESG